MGLPGFEPGSPGPKPGRIAKLPHNPITYYVLDMKTLFKVSVFIYFGKK